MTRRGFAAALARYGADLATWPPAARDAALAKLERSRAARDAFARALDADPSLSAMGASELAIAERLLVPLRGALPSAQPRPARHLWRPRMLGWSAVAAALVLGLWLGGVGGAGAAPGPSPDLFASAQVAPLGLGPP